MGAKKSYQDARTSRLIALIGVTILVISIALVLSGVGTSHSAPSPDPIPKWDEIQTCMYECPVQLGV